MKRIIYVVLFLAFVMPVGMLLFTGASVARNPDEQDDELRTGVQEVIRKKTEPIVAKNPHVIISVGNIYFPDIKDDEKKRKGAAQIIKWIEETLISFEGDVTLLDNGFVTEVLKSNGITNRYAKMDSNAQKGVINETHAAFLVIGSVENGRFNISFIPMDGGDSSRGGNEGGGGGDFDPGRSKFYSEIVDGWLPGPKPEQNLWTAPGKIVSVAINKTETRIAVASNGTEGPILTILDPKTRKEIKQLKPDEAATINAVFFADENLITAYDTRVEVLDPELNVKLTLTLNEDEPSSIAVAMGKLIVGGKAGTINVFDMSTGNPIPMPSYFNTMGSEVHLAVSPKGTTFGISAKNLAWRVSATTLETDQFIKGELDFISVSVTDTKEILLTTSNGAKLYGRDSETPEYIIGDTAMITSGVSTNSVLTLTGGDKLQLFKGPRLIFTFYDAKGGEEVNALTYGNQYFASAHGNTLDIRKTVAEPSSTVVVKNEAKYPALFSFDYSKAEIIQPNEEKHYTSIVPDSYKNVSLSIAPEEGDNLVLNPTKLQLKPGESQTVRITNNTKPRAILIEGALKPESIVKVGNALIVAYPPIVPLKSSRVNAPVIYYNLVGAKSSALIAHDGIVTALVANEKFFVSAGTDRVINVYDAAGEAKASLLTDEIPIGLEFDGDKLLVVLENGVSIIENIDSVKYGKLKKLNSASWRGEEITAEIWKNKHPNGTMKKLVDLQNGSRFEATGDYISLKTKEGKEAGAIAFYPTLAWCITASGGSFTGSQNAGQHLRVMTDPTKPDIAFSKDYFNLEDRGAVMATLKQFAGKEASK